MEHGGESAASSFINKFCRSHSPTNSLIKYPTFSNFSKKNFQNAVDLDSGIKRPCKSSWYTDMDSLHVRNKFLLDLPFSRPKCCSGIYNVLVDRKKLKKLQKYDLVRPVRKRTSCLEVEEVEEVERCIPIEFEEKSTITRFPECYTVSECSSEDEKDSDDGDDDEEEECKNDDDGGDKKEPTKLDSCECKLECGRKKELNEEVKPNWKELLHVKERETCDEAVAEEIKKHKMGQDVRLNLSKHF